MRVWNQAGLKTAAAGAALVTSAAITALPVAAETAMTAGVIAERMPQEDRFPYAAGLVEGIAFGRYQMGGQDVASMTCIFDWFYDGDGMTLLVFEAFERFPDYTAGAVVAALTNRACPHE
ncbi:MAG: hypothetical protein ACE37E_08405 [Hyphomicrobiales bacterium]